jgi:flavin reductase (DIM6/NTAB) family NADH-FMN oxidoreductase RutF
VLVESTSIDQRTLRQTLGRFVTGVTVIALETDGDVRAITANSFTSLSLDPPLVLFCLGKETKAGQHIGSVSGFSVSILSHEQQDLSAYFAGSWKDPEPPPFLFTAWEGGPRLEGCIAALGCRVHAIHEGGDHWIVVGQVLATYRVDGSGLPLVFFGGKYMTLGESN